MGSIAATDKFGNPIKAGDHVICKMSEYNNTSSFSIGLIEKVCNVRHQVRKCDDRGNVIMNTFRGTPRPQRMRQIDKFNMAKIYIGREEITVDAIRKMTL